MLRAAPWLVRTESIRRRAEAPNSMFSVCVYVDAGLTSSLGFRPSSKMKLRPVACRRKVRRRCSDARPPRPATAWFRARGPERGCAPAAAGRADAVSAPARAAARTSLGRDMKNYLLGWTDGGGG